MVEYKRVMFLDADLIPLVNLDYLFHLSDPEHTDTATILRPNFIMATRGEPCNTAFFVVEPSLERYNLLQMAIERQHDAGRKLPYPHFSKEDGWGHSFMKARDAWKSIHYEGVAWNFHASHSDQGLMYYYAKYLIQDTSIVIGNRLEHWGPQIDGSNKGKDYHLTLPNLVLAENSTLANHSPIPHVWQNDCDRKPKGNWQCPAPYNNLAHFPGSNKPWMRGHKGFARTNFTGDQDAAYRLWFRTLDKLSRHYSMGLDVKNWNTKHLPELKAPSLGHLATWKDLSTQVYNRQSKTNNTNTKPELVTKAVPANNSNTLPPLPSAGSIAIKVAYAISIIECTDHHKSGQSSIAGLVDASLVLRHSIHQNSIRNPLSGSKYDYEMYAIVHEQAKVCSSCTLFVGLPNFLTLFIVYMFFESNTRRARLI